MSKIDWQQIVLMGVFPLVKSVLSAQVTDLVEHLDVLEGDEDFKNDLNGFNGMLKRLESAAAKSKMPWDDLAVSVVADPVRAKAAELGIILD